MVPFIHIFNLIEAQSLRSISHKIDQITTYVSHSSWASREAFEEWTKSEAFRKGHAGAGSTRGVIAGHPVFEGYQIVL